MKPSVGPLKIVASMPLMYMFYSMSLDLQRLFSFRSCRMPPLHLTKSIPITTPSAFCCCGCCCCCCRGDCPQPWKALASIALDKHYFSLEEQGPVVQTQLHKSCYVLFALFSVLETSFQTPVIPCDNQLILTHFGDGILHQLVLVVLRETT